MTYFADKHKDYEIGYQEVDGYWTCLELNLQAPQLSALRKLIDRADADSRRLNVSALRIGGTWSLNRDRENVLLECTITIVVDDKEVWIKNEKGEREKAHIENLFPATDETRKAFQAWQATEEIRKQASAASDQAKSAIPRFTAELLKQTRKAA